MAGRSTRSSLERVARETLDRLPWLKIALKYCIVHTVNAPSWQSVSYRRWRAKEYPGRPPIEDGPRVLARDGGAWVREQTYRNLTTSLEAEADYVALRSSPGDVPWPSAVAHLVDAAKERKADLVYADVESADGHEPLLVPAWDPELLEGRSYITGLVLVSSRLLSVVEAGSRVTSHHDLMLLLTERAEQVAHVATVLTSTDLACQPDVEAVLRHAERAGLNGAQVKVTAAASNLQLVMRANPLISIVIPSKNARDVISQCIESIYVETTYENFEIVLVDTGSDDPLVRDYYDRVAADHANFRVVDYPEVPFSYAKSCNMGAEAAGGELLVMLNNDTEVVTPDWLERLGAEAARPEIGAVGCLLLYPGVKTVQHAGVGVGIFGIAGNLLAGVSATSRLTPTQELLLHSRRNASAVTAACLAIRAETFAAVGGFDPRLRITYNDVDLCLKFVELGLRNIYLPDVVIVHHESVSISKLVAGRRDWDEVAVASRQFVLRWRERAGSDPYMNPHLSRSDTLCRFVPPHSQRRHDQQKDGSIVSGSWPSWPASWRQVGAESHVTID